jgi:hypothetical protein
MAEEERKARIRREEANIYKIDLEDMAGDLVGKPGFRWVKDVSQTRIKDVLTRMLRKSGINSQDPIVFEKAIADLYANDKNPKTPLGKILLPVMELANEQLAKPPEEDSSSDEGFGGRRRKSRKSKKSRKTRRRTRRGGASCRM